MRKSALILTTCAACLLCAGSTFAADQPKFDLDWYGYFKVDAAYDQNLTSHGNFVMWVQPEVYGNDAQYNMTANETRFGLNLKAARQNGWDVGAKLEFDLFAAVSGASVAENKAMLQLRHAYFTLQHGNSKILAGQSWDLISPLNPATLNYPVLWGAGNIGYRRPQISLWQTVPLGASSKLTLATGFFRTIGNDLTPTFSLALGETSEGADDGTDAGIPSVQGLVDVNHSSASGMKVRYGLSGLWGRLQAETTLGNSEKYESWAAVGHFRMDFPGSFGFQGELYTGSNLGSYFGGILRNSEIDGLKSTGGWGAAFVQAGPQVNLAAGVGVDDPNDEDFTTGRAKNTAYFGTVRYSIVPQVTVGLEVSQWETQYKDADDASTLRVQTSFILNY